MRKGNALGRGSPSVLSCTWTTIGALKAESQAFAQNNAAALAEHLVLNSDRPANAGTKDLTGMLEPLQATKQAAPKCTTPPAKAFYSL